MADKQNADLERRDLDMTTPNVRLPAEEKRTHRSAPAGNRFDLTAMNVGVPSAEEEDVMASRVYPAMLKHPPSPPQQQQRPSSAPRRIPLWVWLASGGAALLLIAAAVLLILFPFNSAFTLKVLEAPHGSRVFVDGIPSGVPRSDGEIIVQGLRANEPREVRVAHDEYNEWSTTVTGENGEVVEVTAKLSPKLKQAPASPATEIDYNGTMMLVAAGPFIMGDNNHQPDEKPEHQVNLPAYYIDKYEVTNEQYRKFCDETRRAYPPNPWWDQNYFNANPQSPVVGISWDDADAYAKWAGKRLPTEEEWEKAASWDQSAQKKRQLPWGDTPDTDRANLGLKRENLRLVAVTENPNGASAYGVFNMAGNVAEWVDAYYQPYEGNQTPNQDYGTKYRVMRGGACFNRLEDARTTRRLYRSPEYTPQEKVEGGTFVIGFRCAVSADDPKLQAHLKARTK